MYTHLWCSNWSPCSVVCRATLYFRLRWFDPCVQIRLLRSNRIGQMGSNLPTPVADALLIQVATSLKATTYLAVASLCVLVYDFAITIDQEVKFVWRQRWSFGKVMYIFIRYATILMMVGHVACMYAYLYYSSTLFKPTQLCSYFSRRYRCRAIETTFVWSEVIIIIAGSSVLIVRTWLLWGGGRWVLAGLIGGLILASGLSIYHVYIEMTDFGILSVNPQLFRGCVVRISSTTWRPILSPLLYETFIIVLTVAKISTTPNRAPLLIRLFVDGTLYYIAVATVLLFTTIGAAYTPASTQFASASAVPGFSYHSIAGRIRINPTQPLIYPKTGRSNVGPIIAPAHLYLATLFENLLLFGLTNSPHGQTLKQAVY
ncbi:unnamed protein product [Rhizoctonia solani]|uniref:DUF6533 domain-containing protein n=1 Tax=Rhizoctonia solani TaxID=456999 RepID=A0A8H3H7U7_9AGAM|nr:unnamed protein product [Rhizoctonia solani]